MNIFLIINKLKYNENIFYKPLNLSIRNLSNQYELEYLYEINIVNSLKISFI
jgi:hypothetical protein